MVAEALDVVEAVSDNDIVAGQEPLDGRIFFRARIFFGFGRAVDGARHSKRLIADQMDLQASGAGIGGRVGNAGLEELLELFGSGRLARGREALGGLAGASYGGVEEGGGWNLRLGRAAGVSISESGEGWTRTDGHDGRRAREIPG